MHNDDRPVGRFLSRREAIALFGVSATASLARVATAQATDSADGLGALDCVAQPEQTEGPYFVDEALERSDIRRDLATGRNRAGAPLALQFVFSRVMPSGACAVLPGAQVDIWHCDALGLYSDAHDRNNDTRGQQFLRGYQVTDASGVARFTTIYPGWYRGRAVHIHFKVRVPGTGGSTDEFTSQLYFPDELTDRVHANAPYAANKGQRLLNSRDMIFREGGTQLVLPAREVNDGYAATFRIAMRLGGSRSSGLSALKKDQIAERGAWMTRRDDRACREHSREEQRRQPGCPAREVVMLQRGQATRSGGAGHRG